MTPFVHLHVHTQYSLLDGAARIGDLVARAKALGQEALAITDHGVLYGIVDFYRACVKEGIKPIIGMEAYVAPRSMEDRDSLRDREYAHLVLLAKNETGYKNLMVLGSEAFTRGFYYKPRIDYDFLSQHTEGLIALSACLAGSIPQALMKGDYAEALSYGQRLHSMFGEDFYIELQNHGLEEQIRILPELKRLARELGVKTVVTNDVHYVTKEDADAQDVLLCIQTQRFQDEENRMRMGSQEFFLKSAEELLLAFPGEEDSLLTSLEIADKCNVQIEFGKRRQPKYEVPEGETNVSYLTKLCEEGLKRKLPGADDAARERLRYELGVITQMGFTDYFLIVQDYIRFAKSSGIVVGPGRGSGAGSLVAYCLDITDVDPLKYHLLFERFLNPERVSMPDIDVDFCYERRQEVIDYAAKKYGEERVAQIVTFGTLKARQVVRDVCKALHFSYADSDRIAKLVPSALDMTLSKALSISPELKTLYDTDENVKRALDLSMKLEGLPRHSSTHASGVVISGVPLTDVVPLQLNDTVLTTQFPMTTLEELGLLKMDFLGLRTLTVVRDTLSLIREQGKSVPDLDRLPFDDPEVYRMITSGETDGVFQLESAGMRQFLAQLRPDCFEDLIAGISLYRPGPMDQIPRYVRGKHNPATVQYAHPLLRPILENTYGCMVYQEQVMEICRSLAGYSMGRSDLVRRAMAKKKHDVMAKEREIFVHGGDGMDGAVARGVPESVANGIFDEMMDFASYAFNKSHAACYAVLAYRTAYLHRYYPVEFMTALINSFLGTIDKVAAYVYTARRNGLTVLPPDVNHSRAKFSVENGCIRFGLAAVRSVGSSVMESMVLERERRGPFRSLFDFCNRTENLTKRMVESLICAGCFDSMGAKRSQLLAVHEQAVDAAAASKRKKSTGQISLFDLLGEEDSHELQPEPVLPDIQELPHSLLLAREREAAGMYLSGHPLDSYGEALASLPVTVQDLMDADGVTGLQDNGTYTVGGTFTGCKQRPTKSGSSIMGYATLEGVTGSVETVLFPKTLQAFANLFLEDVPVMVTGTLSIREDRANSLLIETVRPLEDAVSRTLWIRFPSLTDEAVSRAKALLVQSPGKSKVILVDGAKRIKRQAPEDLYVTLTEDFLQKAEACFGKDNVKVTKETARGTES